MTHDDLKQFHSERPFLPFTIHVSDGASYEAPAPEFLAYRPGARVGFVWNLSDPGFAFIDLDSIARVTFSDSGVTIGAGD